MMTLMCSYLQATSHSHLGDVHYEWQVQKLWLFIVSICDKHSNILQPAEVTHKVNMTSPIVHTP